MYKHGLSYPGPPRAIRLADSYLYLERGTNERCKAERETAGQHSCSQQLVRVVQKAAVSVCIEEHSCVQSFLDTKNAHTYFELGVLDGM